MRNSQLFHEKIVSQGYTKDMEDHLINVAKLQNFKMKIKLGGIYNEKI